jgi:hypothetical protein
MSLSFPDAKESEAMKANSHLHGPWISTLRPMKRRINLKRNSQLTSFFVHHVELLAVRLPRTFRRDEVQEQVSERGSWKLEIIGA